MTDLEGSTGGGLTRVEEGIVRAERGRKGRLMSLQL